MRVRSPRALRIALVLAGAVLIAAVSLSCLGSKPAVQATDPKGPARLAWGEPLVIRWNQELQDIQLQVTPEADVRSELRDGGRAAYVYFDPDEDTREYQVTVTDAVGLSGTHLAQPATFKVDPAARPHLVPENKPLAPSDGDWIRLKWDQPIKELGYQTDYGSGKWETDKGDPSVVWI